MDLVSLGWSAGFVEVFAALEAPELVPGRVAVEDKHAYVVFTESGSRSAVVPGRMLRRVVARSELPKVGDWVALRVTPGSDLAVIEAVLPRRSRLVRKIAGRTVEEQVLAVNVDLAFVVMALDASFNPRRLERFLVMVREGGVRPVVVLNKADLEADPSAYAATARQVAGGTPVVVVSARTGGGMDALCRELRPAETAVFIGTSGVGKSSLINRLYGQEIQPTLEVREHDAKGRHSTTWRELIPLPGGAVVVDTPGMREFQIWMADEGLDEAFPEVEELALSCHFAGCSHQQEPRCAVLQAVHDGRLARDRYAAYLKLKRELDYLAKERREHTFQGRRTRRPPRPPGQANANCKDAWLDEDEA
jgi:ribosome biogenesis GTPase / thiamine phosphate phosphatase